MQSDSTLGKQFVKYSTMRNHWSVEEMINCLFSLTGWFNCILYHFYNNAKCMTAHLISIIKLLLVNWCKANTKALHYRSTVYWLAGDCFNKRYHLISIWIPIIQRRWFYDCHIFIMVIPIPGKKVFMIYVPCTYRVLWPQRRPVQYFTS